MNNVLKKYLSEASTFMYDDNYIVETKVKVDGKAYASKKAAAESLKSKGLSNKQIEDKLKHALKIATDNHLSANTEHKKDAETVYGLYRQGGSVGDRNNKPVKTGSQQDMKNAAKRFNATLSPGEKSYYRIRYVVRPVTEASAAEKALKDHKNKSKDIKQKFEDNLTQHLKNAEELHHYHTKGDGKDDRWAHDKHDYYPPHHKELIDKIKKDHKNGNVNKDDIEKLSKHNKAAAKAMKTIDDTNYLHYARR